MLALLVLRRGQAVERDWIAETLWCDADRTNALFYLRRSLTELRKMLGDEAHRLKSPSPHTLQFDISGIECDLIAFTEALHCADRASLEQAVSLYGGDLVEGCQEEWIFAERTHYERQYLSALEQLASEAAARSAWETATDWLRKLIMCEPERESAQQRLMEALAAQGDFAAVTKAYHHFRLVLHKTLNTTPSTATTALYNRLKQQTQSVSSVAASRTVPLRRLPLPLTSLIGREVECTEIAIALRTARLVTLTGSGGVGKTRLALAVAEANAEQWAQGVWWSDLSALIQGTQIPSALASVLGIHEQGNRELIQTLVGFLQDRELLLIFDNCEHLLADCAELGALLLRECPKLQILATSRQPLGLCGETAWRVPSLSAPSAWDKFTVDCTEQLYASEAARLFIERAQSANRHFRLTPKNAVSIARLCALLDGIPLALELAAVWVRSLSVAHIVHHLSQNITLLENRDRTVPTRHQTMQALIAWSENLLAPKERMLLARLSVFSGGWTLEAAEMICSDEQIETDALLPLLSRLVEQSLVEVEVHEGEGRYRFLETVRQYALGKLEAGNEIEALQLRHSQYFYHLAQSLCPRLGTMESAVLLMQLESEQDNFRIALTNANGTDTAIRLATLLHHFFLMRGGYREGTAALETALKQDGVAPLVRAEALFAQGHLLAKLSEHERGLQVLEEALSLFRIEGKTLREAETLLRLGAGHLACDNNEEARALLAKSLVLSRREGGQVEESRALMLLGILAKNEGASEQAITLLSGAVRVFEEQGLWEDAGIALHNWGNAHKEQGNMEEAKTLYLRSLTVHRQLGKRTWTGINLYDLAECYLAEENLEQARSLAAEALACLQEEPNMLAICLQQNAHIALKQNHFPEAKQYAGKAVAAMHRLGARRNLSYGLWEAGQVAATEGSSDYAAQFLAAAFTLREQLKTPYAKGNQKHFEEIVASVRCALGEAEFTMAWEAGAQMSQEDAVALVLKYCAAEGTSFF